MKKNNFDFFILLFIVVLTILSCKTDKTLSNTFKGKYTVRITSIDFKELEKASEQVQTELEKGKKELEENLEKAQKEIEDKAEITIDGKKADLNDLVGKMGDGLGKIMDGVSEIGSGLGDFGKNLTETIIKNTSFVADFQEDGTLTIGSNNDNMNFSSKDMKWTIEDGKLIVRDKDKSNDSFSFELKPNSGGEWELVSDKISLVLRKAK
jgi:hypothetical protein